jgi:hypothetical protein
MDVWTVLKICACEQQRPFFLSNGEYFHQLLNLYSCGTCLGTNDTACFVIGRDDDRKRLAGEVRAIVESQTGVALKKLDVATLEIEPANRLTCLPERLGFSMPRQKMLRMRLRMRTRAI